MIITKMHEKQDNSGIYWKIQEALLIQVEWQKTY